MSWITDIMGEGLGSAADIFNSVTDTMGLGSSPIGMVADVADKALTGSIGTGTALGGSLDLQLKLARNRAARNRIKAQALINNGMTSPQNLFMLGYGKAAMLCLRGVDPKMALILAEISARRGRRRSFTGGRRRSYGRRRYYRRRRY